jgi:UDP-N-acetylmuramate dehydrogenase
MNAVAAELREILKGPVLVGEPLRLHTTWRIGGPAGLFITPRNEEELFAALRLLTQVGMSWIALGTGSNLLIRDGGFSGAVIHTGALRDMEFHEDGSARVGGGLPVMRLIRQCVQRGLAGLEELAGIPATVGGAAVMNAGAGKQNLAGVLEGVFLVGPEGQEYWSCERLDLRYRASAVPSDRIVTAAALQFGRASSELLAKTVKQRLLARRQAQGVGKPNAGSVFKNPPGFQAWRLIDDCGLRGRTVGGAQISEKHANFIINRGGARASDVLTLIDEIKKKVQRQTGIELEPEIRVIGEA